MDLTITANQNQHDVYIDGKLVASGPISEHTEFTYKGCFFLVIGNRVFSATELKPCAYLFRTVNEPLVDRHCPKLVWGGHSHCDSHTALLRARAEARQHREEHIERRPTVAEVKQYLLSLPADQLEALLNSQGG